MVLKCISCCRVWKSYREGGSHVARSPTPRSHAGPPETCPQSGRSSRGARPAPSIQCKYRPQKTRTILTIVTTGRSLPSPGAEKTSAEIEARSRRDQVDLSASGRSAGGGAR